MTGPPRRRGSRLGLMAVMLGIAGGAVLPAVALSDTANAAKITGVVAAKPTTTSTCAGNSGGHGQGNNCTGGTSAPNVPPTPTTVTTTGAATGPTGVPGAGAGTGGTGTGGTGTGGGGTTADSGRTGADQVDPGAGGSAPGVGAPVRAARVGGQAAGADGATGPDDTVGVPTPGPAGPGVITVPGTSLPLWPVLWTGTAVITLATLATLLFLRDKRTRPASASDADGDATDRDDGSGDMIGAAGPVSAPREPIKLEWSQPPG